MDPDEGCFGGSCLLLCPLHLFLVAHREYQGPGDGAQSSKWPGNFPGNVRDAFRMKCGDQEGFNCQRRSENFNLTTVKLQVYLGVWANYM